MMRVSNVIVYTNSKWRWNYNVTPRTINKLIHLWLWHFDLHLPLNWVYLDTVNSAIGNGGLSRFRSRQSSTPGASCSKFPAWSLHTFADLAKKEEASNAFLCWWTFNMSISKRVSWLEFFSSNETEEDIGEARDANVERISESAKQKQHDTMWQSAEVSNIVSGLDIPNH